MRQELMSSVEGKVDYVDTASFREQVQDVAKRFKTNWIELAKHLYTVKKDKLFKGWGYVDFDEYCAKEISIKKQTAFKLLNSYHFLTREEPQFLVAENLQKKKPDRLPDYEAVNILRKAKANKELKETDYKQLREDVFERASEPRELGKQFRSMIWAAKDIDPEQERADRRMVSIKRLLSTFRTLKKEAEILKLLPGEIIKEAENVVASIEAVIGKGREEN